MKNIILALSVFVAVQTSALAQTQTPTLRGTLVRNGTSEPIPNAKISLNTQEAFQTLSAIASASTKLILGREESETAVRYLTQTPGDLEAQIASLKSASITPDLITALGDLHTARSKAPGFPKTTISDAQGRFSFADVPPGRYVVVSEREGFYGVPTSTAVVPYATAAVTVGNQVIPEINMAMTSGALISGRVRDANGQSVVGVNVQAFTTTYKAGLPVLEAVTEKTTDDRGQYRLFWLPAGEYLIAATPRPTPPPAGSIPANVKTFHPSTPQVSLATPIKVRIGEEAGNIDIDFAALRAVKVSGKVVNSIGPRTDLPPGAPVPIPNVALMLMQREPNAPDDTRNSVIGTIPVTAGVVPFELSNVLPGRYDIYARMPDPRGSTGQGGQALAWGRSQIEVFDRDLTDITLTVHASVPVAGTLTLNGAAPGAAANTIRAALAADGSSSKMPNYNGLLGRPATPAADGKFSIAGVAEANYRFVVSGLPADAYVDDIRADARSVFDSGLYVTDKAPEALQILVNTGGGAVEGTATTADRRPFPGSTVVLIPETARRQNATLYKTATTDARGAFSIRGVRPGAYRIFAWESISDGAYLNPIFLSKYEGQGIAVSVSPSTTSNATLTVIPKN